MTWDEVRDAISAHEARTLALPLTRGQRFEAIRLSATIKDVCYHLRYHDAPPPGELQVPQEGPDASGPKYCIHSWYGKHEHMWLTLHPDGLGLMQGGRHVGLSRHQCSPCEPFIEALTKFANTLRRTAP